ncbi:MAG: hypothetical protein KDC03_21680, partial [Flavobacteriales bacterium]|nr:hypothetical protein [Flavobacteriales bacterium]
MKRLLLLCTLAAPVIASAQLAPGTSAPLAAHMLEVNAEWRSYNGALAATPVRFQNDTERIARHLHLVRAHLAAHTPEGLSAEQLDARLELLDDLGSYAERGVIVSAGHSTANFAQATAGFDAGIRYGTHLFN